MTFKNKKLFHLLLVLLPIFCFIVVSDIFVADITDIKQDTNTNIARLEEKKQQSIHYIIDNRIRQAKMQNNYIEDTFKSYISGYDKNELKEEMKEDVLDTKVVNILSNIIIYDTKITNLFETHYADHILFISNKNGIINVYNLSSNNPEIVFTNWSDYIAKKNNTKLTSSAIDRLINKVDNDENLVWESSIATYNGINNENYTISSNDTINEILDSNDSTEYKYYNMLIPTYVNISNQDSNYDFIIVREINLYKAIEPFGYNLSKYDTIIEDYNHEMNNLLYVTILFSISITLSLAVSIIIAVIKTNNYIKYRFKFKRDGDK